MNLTEKERQALSRLSDEEAEIAEQNMKKIRESLASVLNTEQGQYLLWFIFDSCGLYAQSFTGNSWQAFLDGKRSVALEILELINATCPEKWIEMQQKNLTLNSFVQKSGKR